MRKLAILLALTLVFGLVAMDALAADKVIKATIQSTIEKTGNDGNPYIRFIINEDRTKTINGTSHPYTVGVAIMCFGNQVEQARLLSQGDELHAIAQAREWQGRTSYVLLKFLE